MVSNYCGCGIAGFIAGLVLSAIVILIDSAMQAQIDINATSDEVAAEDTEMPTLTELGWDAWQRVMKLMIMF